MRKVTLLFVLATLMSSGAVLAEQVDSGQEQKQWQNNKEFVFDWDIASKDPAQNLRSFEIRWGVNGDVPLVIGKEKSSGRLTPPSARLVSAIGFENFHRIVQGKEQFLDSHDIFVWRKWYVDFRQRKRLRPYIGLAFGLYTQTVVIRDYDRANDHDATAAYQDTTLVGDFLFGVRLYPLKHVVLNLCVQTYRGGLKAGVGYTF